MATDKKSEDQKTLSDVYALVESVQRGQSTLASRVQALEPKEPTRSVILTWTKGEHDPVGSETLNITFAGGERPEHVVCMWEAKDYQALLVLLAASRMWCIDGVSSSILAALVCAVPPSP